MSVQERALVYVTLTGIFPLLLVWLYARLVD